jgi:predicted Zn finger-like uncharacterized protein
MNIVCPECSTVYRVDPDRVPGGGVTTRCRECDTEFRVNDAMTTAPGELVTAPRVESAEAALPEAEPAGAAGPATPETEAPRQPEEPSTTAAPSDVPDATAPAADAEPETGLEETASEGAGAPVFGPQDPDTRARRLARALVSDIKVYHPEKWEESAEAGTLRSDFRDEILKSWEEYVEQVGEEMAKKTPFFRDALNEILAQGDRVF